MSFMPLPHAPGPAPPGREQLLFTPGPRLGWVFRDRRELAVPYPEPQPSPQVIQTQAATRTATADQALARAWRWTGKPSIALAALLAVLAGCSKSVSGSFNLGLTAITIIVLCGPGLAYTGWCWLRRDQARDVTPADEYQQALAEWGQRAAEHETAELARLGGQPEWGSVISPGSRTDVFGGTLAGWQALLVVHGASILAERQLLAVDLTGQHYAAEVLHAIRRAGARFSVTVPHNSSVRAAIAAVPEDAWTPIRYLRAVFDEQLGCWVSEAEAAEVPYTAFTGSPARGWQHEAVRPMDGRLIIRRVQDQNTAGQDGLFPVWRHHAVFTDSPFTTLQAEGQHRDHAIIEQVFADCYDGPLARLPSGKFAASAARLTCAAIAHNLLRAAGTLASRAHGRARGATLRRDLIAVAARTARHGRDHITVHLREGWHREHEWLSLHTACGPPAAAA
jgi:hypothetical protein